VPGVQSVVIVGDGAAGLSVAQSLRGDGYAGRLTLLGDEAELPYDRPPLSKQILAGSWDTERARLLPGDRMGLLRADVPLGARAAGLDTGAHEVMLSDGRVARYDALVVATGIQPRQLPCGNPDRVHVLRTIADSLRLRRVLSRGPGIRLVIAGAGFLGLEVAATARRLGAEVVVVEPAPRPLASRIGSVAAARLLALHQSNGVRILTGVGIEDVTGPPGALHPEGDGPHLVRLTSGAVLEADAVLAAIGCSPRLDWLSGSGIIVSDGVLCDEFCQAGPDVWAAGDVARWLHQGLGRHIRLEHRMNATEQGRAVALNILGARRPFCPVPFFWTDHYETKIQVSGFLPEDARCELADGSPDSGSFVQTFWQADTLVGVLGWNAARAMTKFRRSLGSAPDPTRVPEMNERS
jgi:3-phenylpropionate/trans-cinnamate dioxygenase ferredoxin reductase component